MCQAEALTSDSEAPAGPCTGKGVSCSQAARAGAPHAAPASSWRLWGGARLSSCRQRAARVRAERSSVRRAAGLALRVAHGSAVTQQSRLLGGRESKEGNTGLSSCPLWAADARLRGQGPRLTMQTNIELLNVV